ncbi:chemotaxis protein CheW [Massilia sp. YIM B04103]|uniref:chemotaxis protein CheW n=1 Tax=Massilia sp. YIM B04103 TaxID=2963106 RepID=UPI00210BB458|nr:chemotaxis protein CheW [Massilia sp. YIM B04103]
MIPGALGDGRGYSAQTLREQFDRSFALAPALPAAGSLSVLTIRVGDERYAIGLPDICGLYVDRSILALPGPLPELLGVTGFRGQSVPVYELAGMLGKSGGAAPRWMVLMQTSAPLAFAFDGFETHLCATADQLIAAANSAGAQCKYDAVRTDGGVLTLLPMRELAAQIAQRVAQIQRRAHG